MMDEIKETLLQYLISQSHSLLVNQGCPLEKNQLLDLSTGSGPKSLPAGAHSAFVQWLRDQQQHPVGLERLANGHHLKHASSGTDLLRGVHHHRRADDAAEHSPDRLGSPGSTEGGDYERESRGGREVKMEDGARSESDENGEEQLNVEDDGDGNQTIVKEERERGRCSPGVEQRRSPQTTQGAGMPRYTPTNHTTPVKPPHATTPSPPALSPYRPYPHHTTTSPYGTNNPYTMPQQPHQPHQPQQPHQQLSPAVTGGSLTTVSQPSSLVTVMTYGNRTRARTSFDPEQEVPRLQKWFEHNQHPTRDQMCSYMTELNSLPSRHGRRALDLTNIIYWFKNARAASRRAVLSQRGAVVSPFMDTSFSQDSSGHSDTDNTYDDIVTNAHDVTMTSSPPPHGDHGGNGESERRVVPELPNRNAVYVVTPIHCSDDEESNRRDDDGASDNKGLCHMVPSERRPIEIVPEDENSGGGSKPHDFTVPKISVEHIHKAYHHPSAYPNNLSLSAIENNNKLYSDGSVRDAVEKRLNSSFHHRDLSPQPPALNDDAPTDLSLPKKRRLSEDRDDGERESPVKREFKEDVRLMIKTHSVYNGRRNEDDEEGYGSSNASSPSPSPKSLNSSGSSGLGMTLGGAPPPPHHPLGFSMTQQALHMAAMSHALNMGYMHPAAMFGGGLHAGLPGGLLAPPGHPHPAVGGPPTAGHPPSPYSTSSTSPRPPLHSPSNHTSPSSHMPSYGHLHHHSNSAPPHHHHHHHSNHLHQHRGGSESSSLSSQQSSEERKKRSRVFIDPLTEIPKLEKWFIEDTHPSSYMIEKFTDELNNQPYRQRFPNLEPKNIQLWFKNHRAKVKRARQEQVALCQINHQNAIKTN